MKKDTIFATPEHPFYVKEENADGSNQGHWTSAGSLKKGLKIALVTGLLANVESVFAIDTTATVYNFEVEKTHTYYVGTEGVLVHNSCGIEALRKIKTGLTDAEWLEFKNLIKNLDPPSGVPTTPIISTAEKLAFYKELAKLDDAALKVFYSRF
jgi:hypothetical protein